MQPMDQSITRRPLDIEDYIDILRRHKSWIFGPTFAAIVVGTVVAFLWPDTYVSTGMVRAVPPKVPESYVQINVAGDLQGRFNSMVQSILTKQRLQAIIAQFDLYKKELKRMPMEDVVEQMKAKDIRITPVQTINQTQGRTYSSFTIGFACTSRTTAQKVAQKIIVDLITENQGLVTEGTKETTELLQNSREGAKKKLDDLEQRLSDFRQRNLGHLPEQQATNFGQMNALQTQVLNINGSMSRVTQDKLLLEGRIKAYREQLSQLKDPVVQEQILTPRQNEKLVEKERELTYYEAALAQARERYKETHPDVQTLVSKVAATKRQRDEILKEENSKKPETQKAVVNPEIVRQQRDLEASVKQLQVMLETKDIEMQDLQKSLAQTNSALKSISERLAGMPVGLKEYEELMRDRDLAKKAYEEIDTKVTASVMATKAITNNQGETLEQIEFASLPATPTEPKRPVIILASAGIGLMLGIFLAGAREVKDTSLKNLKDVRAYTQLPVLGSIPLLENDLIVRRRRRLGWLAWATACLVGVIVMSTSVLYYISTSRS